MKLGANGREDEIWKTDGNWREVRPHKLIEGLRTMAGAHPLILEGGLQSEAEDDEREWSATV